MEGRGLQAPPCLLVGEGGGSAGGLFRKCFCCELSWCNLEGRGAGGGGEYWNRPPPAGTSKTMEIQASILRPPTREAGEENKASHRLCSSTVTERSLTESAK